MITGPSASAAVVVESAPLWVVADMVRAGNYDVVIVLADDQSVRGMVRSDAVLRLSPRLPEAPVRLLPLQSVVEVPATITLADAQALLSSGRFDALLVEKLGQEGWTVLLRDDVLLGGAPQALSA